MSTAFLSLGSNGGDRAMFLHKALDLLTRFGICIVRKSSIYETEPVSHIKQPWFLNMVVKIKTDLSPVNLLSLCKVIEKSLGRKKRTRWARREIDLDILLYGRTIVNDRNLIIPHKEMFYRLFVLTPFDEIAPRTFIPLHNITVHKALLRCADSHTCRLVNG